ncbi:hypothetical protein D9M68_18040 [compost metagenome]
MDSNASDVMVLSTAYFIQDIGLVPKVKGLYRDHTPGRHRWVVSHNNDTSTKSNAVFYDRVHGNAQTSYKEAMKYLYSISEIVLPGTRRVLHERANKAIKVGEPGICVSVKDTGMVQYYYICVGKMAEVPAVYFCGGNSRDKDDRYVEAIAAARVERARTVKKYRGKRRVKLSEAMPWKIVALD